MRTRALGAFRDGDMILCLGAGSITKLADQLALAFSQEPTAE